MIETRLLYYFLAVARELNVTKAADALHLTQSTLSRQMIDLERQLGKQLFTRGKRRITLTDEGRFLRDRARAITSLIDATEASLKGSPAGLSGDLTIGCGETPAMDTVARLLARYKQQHPRVVIHLHSGSADTVLNMLDAELADLAVVIGLIKQERYETITLSRSNRYGLLVRSDSPLARQDAINIDQLKTLPLIMPERVFSGQQDIDWFGTDRTALNAVAGYNLIANAAHLVRHGIGHAFCLDGLTAAPGLTFRPITPEMTVTVSAVTKRYQAFSPQAKAFIDLLTAHALKEFGTPPEPDGLPEQLEAPAQTDAPEQERE